MNPRPVERLEKTLARVAKGEGFFTVLLAGDKDFMQIVDPRTLLLDTMYDRWVGPDEVLAKTGVRPDQIVEEVYADLKRKLR